MIVITRYRIAQADRETFLAQARTAVVTLRERPGFRSADLARNLDEPDLFTLTTRWDDVGSYRRALHSYETKVAVVPLLSRALDEPSAYEDVELVGPQQARDLDAPPIV